MRNRFFFLFLLLIMSGTLSACTLCSVYSPLTQAKIDIYSDQQMIKGAKVTLRVTEDFTQSLKQVYDTNGDDVFDEKELLEIGEIFEEYAQPKNYFVTINYASLPNELKPKKFLVSNFRSTIINNILHFSYDVEFKFRFYDDYFLSFEIFDDESFFLLEIAEAAFVNYPEMLKEQRGNRVIFNLQNKGEAVNQEQSQETTSSNASPFKTAITPEQKIEEKELSNEQTMVQLFTSLLKQYLLEVQEGNSKALFSLLLISFAYGMFHALGPGHSKAFAFSYFSVHKTSMAKAFAITQISSFVHIIGALILVLISMFILESILNNFIDNSITILTQIAAGMIILLSVYLLYSRVKNKSCHCSSCCESHSDQPMQFSATKPTNVLTPNKTKDLWFIITSGLIPCPGTVLLFIYAFTLKTYTAVILASLMISFGMGVVVFAAAFLGLGVQKLSNNSHRLMQIVQIGAPLFMMLLGVLLFIGAELL